MKWRDISEEEITSALINPDKKEDTINGRYNVYKDISGRVIKVTYKETADEIYVITTLVKSKK